MYWIHEQGFHSAPTMVHSKPSGNPYGVVDAIAPGDTLTAALLPAFSVSLGALKLHLD